MIEQPKHPLILKRDDLRIVWKPVRCPECGKLLCEVSPGSVVKIRCKSCRVYVEKEAA